MGRCKGVLTREDCIHALEFDDRESGGHCPLSFEETDPSHGTRELIFVTLALSIIQLALSGHSLDKILSLVEVKELKISHFKGHLDESTHDDEEMSARVSLFYDYVTLLESFYVHVLSELFDLSHVVLVK